MVTRSYTRRGRCVHALPRRWYSKQEECLAEGSPYGSSGFLSKRPQLFTGRTELLGESLTRSSCFTTSNRKLELAWIDQLLGHSNSYLITGVISEKSTERTRERVFSSGSRRQDGSRAPSRRLAHPRVARSQICIDAPSSVRECEALCLLAITDVGAAGRDNIYILNFKKILYNVCKNYNL